MESSLCAAPCAKVSDRVSAGTARPRRLYYRCYYTRGTAKSLLAVIPAGLRHTDVSR